MADWYVSSAVFAALTVWTAGATHSVGDIVRAVSPSADNRHTFRCTTAGTSGGTEPSWSLGYAATTSDGSVVWTLVTGLSTYGWSAPGGTLGSVNGAGSSSGFVNAGDRVFFSSDHSETTNNISNNGRGTNDLLHPTYFCSVNRASGRIPPLVADITPGATLTGGGGTVFVDYHSRFEGITVDGGGSNICLGYNTNLPIHLKNCLLRISGSGGNSIYSNNAVNVLLDNTPVYFTSTSQTIDLQGANSNFAWRNTPSAVQGTALPVTLFAFGNGSTGTYTLTGVDLSALGSGKALASLANKSLIVFLSFVDCKLGSGVAVTSDTLTGDRVGPTIELVNCDTSSNIRSERWTSFGTVLTEGTIVLTGGASDGTTPFSRKMVSATAVNDTISPLESLPMLIWNDTTGTAKTATVEVISSGSLTNKDIWLDLEYLGDGSSPLSSIAYGHPGPLAGTTTWATSSETWAAQPSTPVKQSVSIGFTPANKGWVRGTLRLGKPTTTVYYNPQIAIT